MKIQILEIIYLLGGVIFTLGIIISSVSKSKRKTGLTLCLIAGASALLAFSSLIKIEGKITQNIENWTERQITSTELVKHIGSPTEIIEEGSGSDYSTWKYTIHFYPVYTYEKEMHFDGNRLWGYSHNELN